jgi:integrase
VWTAEEASVLLSGVRGDALEGLWRLALIAGLRRGELLGLRWADLDLRAGTLTVDTTRVRLGGDIVEDGPKSAASRRTVHLDPGTVEVLRRSRAAGTGGGRHVFTDTDGRPLDPAAVSRRFHEVREGLGLPRIRLHDLRHTSATFGLAAGESLKEVSARLGHAALSVTADLYTEVTPGLARASAQRLAAWIDSRGGSGEAGAA